MEHPDHNAAVESWPFPDQSTHVCGISVLYNDVFHFMGGYNFPDIMNRKFDCGNEKLFDHLQTQCTTVTFDDGTNFSMHEMDYCRLIGASCVYAPEFESSFIFGGMYEEVGANADLSSIFISSRIIIKNWREDNTVVLPSSLIQPLPRLFHAATWDSDRSVMWIFGGGSTQTGKTTFYNDLWCWSAITHQWTQIKAENPPMPQWGCSMVYNNDRLILLEQIYHGNKGGNKSLRILNLISKPDPVWIREKIASMFRHYRKGASINTCFVPGLGNRILVVGGGADDILCDLSFSGSLSIQHNPEGFAPLNIFVIEPNSFNFLNFTFDDIPNVSYHSTQTNGRFLYIAGGLNTYTNGRAFGRECIRVDLLKLLGGKIDVKVPEEIYPQRTTPPKFDEIIQLIKSENNSYNWNPIIKMRNLFHEHQREPPPIDDCICISGVFASTEIVRKRLRSLPLRMFQISQPFAHDLVYFLYTGLTEGLFIEYSELVENLDFLIGNGLERFVLFSFLLNIENFSIVEILNFTTRRHQEIPLVELPAFVLLKHVCCHIAAECDVSVAELKEVENFESIAIYFMSVFNTTSFLGRPSSADIPASHMPNEIFSIYHVQASSQSTIRDITLPNEVYNSEDAFLVECVLNGQLQSIVDNDSSLMFDAIRVLDMAEDLAIESLELRFRPIKQKLLGMITDEFRAKLIGYLPKVKTEIILAFIIHLIGFDGDIELVSSEGSVIRVNSAYLAHLTNESHVNLQIPQIHLIAFLILVYSGCYPNELPMFIDRRDFSFAMFELCWKSTCFIPEEVAARCGSIVAQNIFASLTEEKFLSGAVKYIMVAARMEILDPLFSVIPMVNILGPLNEKLEKSTNPQTIALLLRVKAKIASSNKLIDTSSVVDHLIKTTSPLIEASALDIDCVKCKCV